MCSQSAPGSQAGLWSFVTGQTGTDQMQLAPHNLCLYVCVYKYIYYMCVCVFWVAVSPGGKFYEHGNEAIIHYTAEQTRDYTGNYLILAILQLASSHGQPCQPTSFKS